MITATNLKAGTTFLLSGKPYKVIKYTHQKIGRGGANVKVSLRNLQTHSLSEKTFSSSTKFDETTTTKRPLQYLYQDNQDAIFMNPNTFEQITIPRELLSDDISFLKQGQLVDILFWDDKPLSIELPPKVTLKIAQTTPGLKGNSATNMYKPATLENNLQIKVPLFIKKGDKIRLDTRTKEYLERVN
jgi:elongation factor P